MSIRIPSALKHGAFSALGVLPGESQAAFDKLRARLVTEYAVCGAHEEDIVADLAHLIWRKQNLVMLRIAECAKERRDALTDTSAFYDFDGHQILRLSEQQERDAEEKTRTGEVEAQKELGDAYALTELEGATFDGLIKELDVRERLDSLIDKCLKRLLMVRGVKSISAASPAATPKQISSPPKAA